MRLGRITIGPRLLTGVAIVVVSLCVLWSQRRPIAARAIDRALAARGVSASYTIADIGFRTQRIENLRLGDRARPDLTAASAEVLLAPSWGGVTVTSINARGVRLRGSVADGRVSWGAVDRLLPKRRDAAFALPDIDVKLADTRVTLTTDLGTFDATITGAGKLSNGFAGRMRVVAPIAGPVGCRLDAPSADAAVMITARRPHIVGTLFARPSTCRDAMSGPIQARFDAVLGPSLDSWRGTATIASHGIWQGALQLARPTARLNFAGSSADTAVTFALASPAARYADTRLAGVAAHGTLAAKTGKIDAKIRMDRAIADPTAVAALRRGLAFASDTPVGPLALALSQAIGRAGEGAQIDAVIAISPAGARFSDIRMTARGGAVLTAGKGAVEFGRGAVVADIELALVGGGFPEARGRLVQASDGSTRGAFEVGRYRAAAAEVSLAPVRFVARTDGTMRVETSALIDGPLAGGRVEGIRLPIVLQRAASGTLLIAPGCTPITYRRVVAAATSLAPGKATLCPVRGRALFTSARQGFSGGARTGPLRLTGTIGDQPLILDVSSGSYGLGGPIKVTNLAVQSGPGDRRTQIAIGRIEGSQRAGELSGRYAGLSGKLARVPFLASAGAGNWSFARGVLNAGGAITIADQATSPRFAPLAARAIELRLAGSKLAARAVLIEPRSARALSAVAIDHDLASGKGEARLTVDGLTFGKTLQPEAITPLTEGVVADLYGTIVGSGLVRWSGDAVTSSGRFRSDGLDFSAAVGPVTGVAGEIVFDDLIALSTPPGQRVTVALVNPGVEVKEGVIDFQLRPDQVVEVERGRWPFAGGQLMLDIATLDFGQTKARKILFRVSALDAAKFIEELKLENIAATGTFDGTLPIEFDAGGGRIVGGRIVARAGGGTLAYVGDVSNAQTNAMTRLAFDALKSVRYNALSIDLDGSLDGEIVSLVRFDGINQSPVSPTGLAKSFTGLPFKFNIRVRAPFRGLVGTARSYQDPSLLLNRSVQPAASDAAPKSLRN